MSPTTVIKLEGVLDLDLLFSGQLVESPALSNGVIEGTPEGGANVTFYLDSFARVKLAGNPRPYGDSVILYDYYSVGGWTKGNFHRTVFQGPLVEGPYAYLGEQSVMITAHAQPSEVAYFIEEGTQIKVKGSLYTVSFPEGRRGKHPTLQLVPEAVAA